MDYGQYKYELSKKQKEAKKKQKVIQVKEIKLRPRSEKHDYDFKMNHAQKFFEHGDKVRFILQFRGREMAHKELGREVMDKVIADFEHLAQVEQAPKQEGRFMNMTLAPLPESQRKRKEEDKEKKKQAEAQQASEEDIADKQDESPSAEDNQEAAAAESQKEE